MFGKKKIIGVDIGSSTIKIAEIVRSGKTYNLLSFGVIPTPQGSISQGLINDTAMVGAAIESLAKELKISRKGVSTGMWGTSVIVKKITMAKVDPKVLGDLVQHEAEQYIPFDINEISLTYKVLKTNPSDEMIDVLLVAAQSELLMRFAESVQFAGMDCSIVDVNSFALANCLEVNYGVFNSTVAIMNFGGEVTNFVVVHRGDIVFCRDIGVGGSSYTYEIHKQLGVTISEAENFKISAINGLEVPDEVHSIISAETERLVEEIRNSFDFFTAANGDLSISKVFYCGGSSYVRALVDGVSMALGLPFEMLNPLQRIKVSGRRLNPEYMRQMLLFSPVVIGLALRETGDE